MTQTPSPQPPKRWFVPYPEKRAITGHPCQDACNGNLKMGQLLQYFIYEASWELEWQGLPESCKVVKFTRSHKHILKKVNISQKSLIQFMKQFNEWGFVLSEPYGKAFTVQAEPIQKAMYEPVFTKKIRQKFTSTSEKSTTSSSDTESCKVYQLQEKVEALQLYNIGLEVRLDQALEALKAESCKVVELQQNVEAGKLYNIALSTWIEAASEALKIPAPFIDSHREITLIDSHKESNRDASTNVSHPALAFADSEIDVFAEDDDACADLSLQERKALDKLAHAVTGEALNEKIHDTDSRLKAMPKGATNGQRSTDHHLHHDHRDSVSGADASPKQGLTAQEGATNAVVHASSHLSADADARESVLAGNGAGAARSSTATSGDAVAQGGGTKESGNGQLNTSSQPVSRNAVAASPSPVARSFPPSSDRPTQRAAGAAQPELMPGQAETVPKGRGKKVTQEVIPALPAEALRIMDDWDRTFKSPVARTEKLLKAAIALIPCKPTMENLRDCKNWLFTTDNPQKPWFRKKGVSLQDVAEHYGEWQSVREPPQTAPAPRPKSTAESSPMLPVLAPVRTRR